MSITKVVNQKAKELFKDLVGQYTEEDLRDHLDGGHLYEHYIFNKDELQTLLDDGKLELPERGKHYQEWLKQYREEDYDARTLHGKRADKMEVWAYYIDGLIWQKVDKMVRDHLNESK